MSQEETALVGPDDIASLLAENPSEYDASLAEMGMSGSKFLPALRLCGGSSEVVKAGLITAGHWAYFKQKDMTQMGKSFSALVLDWHPFAIRFDENVVKSFDPNSDLFKTIRSEADADSQSSSKYGPEFLIYLPDKKLFVSYFASAESARNRTDILATNRGKVFLFESELAKNKKGQTWSVPKFTIQSAPPAFNLDQTVLLDQVKKFRDTKAKESEVEEQAEEVAQER